ncbi:MAG: Uracil glycosylase superfamily protein [Nitrospira sp.]|jgi:DNA polymerase|nr:Uracil glycosylase superfamily protein [Nitrospira sp.]
MREVRFYPAPDGWLAAATEQLLNRRKPSDILWTETTAEQSALPGLFTDDDDGRPEAPPPGSARGRFIPHDFRKIANIVAYHRDASKWALLYSVLWRLTSTEPRLLAIEVDGEVARLLSMQRQVQRDSYHMKAFVRFRKVVDEAGDHYIAWHQPDHPVLPLAIPFFVERFAALRWSILTPQASAHWDCELVRMGPGVTQRDAPTDDALEAVWRAYYAATFNPARINPSAMQTQLPDRFWKGLPESRLISPLSQAVRASVGHVMESRQRMASLPMTTSFTLPELAEAAATCRGCDLHLAATQTVFGRGPSAARIMLVGEQPGDQEDLAGVPFVGPAGELLDRALIEAQLDRSEIYVTNAVKHFRFLLEGRRRRHQAPRPSEIVACRPWLEAELKVVRPEVVICLGRTAAQSIIGGQVSMERQRGRFYSSPFSSRILLTYHPSSILRARDRSAQDRLFNFLVDDLKKVAV